MRFVVSDVVAALLSFGRLVAGVIVATGRRRMLVAIVVLGRNFGSSSRLRFGLPPRPDLVPVAMREIELLEVGFGLRPATVGVDRRD